MKKVLIALACVCWTIAQAQTVEFWKDSKLVKAAYKTAFANGELKVADVADYEVRIVQSLEECQWITVGTVEGKPDFAIQVADRNLGASSPEDPGLYFAWGEMIGYSKDAGKNFTKPNEAEENVPLDYVHADSRCPYAESLDLIATMDPANRMLLGFKDLSGGEFGIMSDYIAGEIEKWAKSTSSDAKCIIWSNGSESIKFPKSGYISGTTPTDTDKAYMWSSAVETKDSKRYAISYYIDSNNANTRGIISSNNNNGASFYYQSTISRYCGMPVRPVRIKKITNN